MVAAVTLAITGATGFVGSHLLDLALAQGHLVRALTRRPQPDRPGVRWINGAFNRPASLDSLVDGAEAVIHVAGVVNALEAAGFEAGNVTGTGAMLAAAGRAGIRRFVHVSSLAAREPGLSLYGASKASSEILVETANLPFVIVRPPAVYGPGDRELLDMFKMARRGLVLLPPEGRLSLLHADDLGRLLLALADPTAPAGLTIEPDDGRPGGWTHREFATALGAALGRKVRAVSASAAVIRAAARFDRLVRGAGARLTPDRASYFCHPDWLVDPAKAAPDTLWTATVDTRQGLRETAIWYREAGWL